MYGVMEVVRDHLGLALLRPAVGSPSAHIATCTAPNCSDLRTIIGEFPNLDGVVFGDDQVYFSILADRTIYACSFPFCPEGPRAFAQGSSSRLLTTNRDWVYWLENGEAKRKRKDGSSTAETLEFGPVLGRAVDAGTGPTANAVVASRIATADSWLYALLSSSSDADIQCNDSPVPCLIARWPDDALGGAREVVYKSKVPIDSQASIRVFGGELVFRAEQTYSCDAANCPATLRGLGEADPDRMTSDGDHIYWCMRSGAGIQQVARLRR